jgi:hypothetical protein
MMIELNSLFIYLLSSTASGELQVSMNANNINMIAQDKTNKKQQKQGKLMSLDF